MTLITQPRRGDPTTRKASNLQGGGEFGARSLSSAARSPADAVVGKRLRACFPHFSTENERAAVEACWKRQLAESDSQRPPVELPVVRATCESPHTTHTRLPLRFSDKEEVPGSSPG